MDESRRAAQPVNCGAFAARAQRWKTTRRLRRGVPLARVNVVLATILCVPRLSVFGRTAMR
jgi:hypothetical protein